MKTLTKSNIRTVAEIFAVVDGVIAVRVKGMEEWIHPDLRGRPSIEVDCGRTPHGASRCVWLALGERAPSTSAEAGEMVGAMLATHQVRSKAIAAKLYAERDNSR